MTIANLRQSTMDSGTREAVAHGRRLIREAMRASRRAKLIDESRNRLRSTLRSLSRYDDRYAELLDRLEESWNQF